MTVSKSSRREFLSAAGATLAGISIVSASPASLEAAKLVATSQDTSLEKWLLNTGRDELTPQLYQIVQQQIREN